MIIRQITRACFRHCLIEPYHEKADLGRFKIELDLFILITQKALENLWFENGPTKISHSATKPWNSAVEVVAIKLFK